MLPTLHAAARTRRERPTASSLSRASRARAHSDHSPAPPASGLRQSQTRETGHRTFIPFPVSSPNVRRYRRLLRSSRASWAPARASRGDSAPGETPPPGVPGGSSSRQRWEGVPSGTTPTEFSWGPRIRSWLGCLGPQIRALSRTAPYGARWLGRVSAVGCCDVDSAVSTLPRRAILDCRAQRTLPDCAVVVRKPEPTTGCTVRIKSS